MIGVSPTYLSKVERDEFAAPAEDKVKAIAKIIDCDADDLMARAGRVSSDLADIIKRHPVELAALLRTTKGLSADEMTKLARQVQKAKDKGIKPCHSDADEDPNLMAKVVPFLAEE